MSDERRGLRPGAPGLLVCLALAACAGPAPQRAEPLTNPWPQALPPTPGAWAAAAQGAPAGATASQSQAAPGATDAALQRWWTRWGDAQLDALVAQALQAHTEIDAAAARLRQARALLAQAEAALAPTFTLGGTAQRSAADGRSPTSQYRAGLDAGWELDLWGGNAAGVRAARASAEAGALTLAQTRAVVAAEVASTLLQWRGAAARREMAARNLALQQQTLQIVQWRLEAGLATTLELEQARTSVEQTRAQLPALDTAALQARHALAVLTGQPPAALLALPVQPLPEPADDWVLALPAEVLRQRADVQAAERRVQAARARVAQADAAARPGLSISGSLGLSALTLSGLGPGAGVASLLASVRWPLLDGGRQQAQQDQQAAARDEALAQQRAAVLGALQEVEDTLGALAGQRAQLASQQQAAEAAERAATLAEQRWRSGLVDFQNVLQSQRTLLSLQDAVAASRQALALAQVRLVKALGGGAEAEAPLPTRAGAAPEETR